jgi:hypothetical protein
MKYDSVCTMSVRNCKCDTTHSSHLFTLHARIPLTSHLQGHAYWYEIVECLRRLLLTAFLVFIPPRSGTQAAVACTFAVLTMLLFSTVLPLRSRGETDNYLIGCVILFVSMFAVLLIQGGYAAADSSGQGVVAVVLIGLIALLAASVLAQMIAAMRAMFKLQRSESALPGTEPPVQCNLHDGADTHSSVDELRNAGVLASVAPAYSPTASNPRPREAEAV